MHRATFLASAIAAAALLSTALFGALAQSSPPAGKPAKLPLEKPYQAVPVTLTSAPADPALEAFRAQLAIVAKDRVYADLARHVVGRGFFWDGDAGGLDPRRPPVENFAAAIRLEAAGGQGWNSLAALAASADAAPLPSRPGVICAPAAPEYDAVDFQQLMSATASKPAVWRFPRADGLVMRAVPRPTGRPIETLGLHFVRLLDAGALLPTVRIPSDWSLVAAPSGKTGFVLSAALVPVHSDRLCYHKDVTGRWRIAGYITASR